MSISRWVSRALAVVALGALFALSACSPNAVTSTGSTPTDTPTSVPTATPTLAPPMCGSAPFSANYVTMLPDATFNATNIYAQIPLPPLTRSFDNDASGGLRGRQMCSAGTADSVLAFMTQNLTQLGWQQIDQSTQGCIGIDASLYKTVQCWKNGTYTLTLGINSSTDWLVLFRDPDFNP
ncbi:MAG TPA: hypothetical protein VH540_20030 [Ktedonobacterales bacterium]|jgi:hypothetical protein